MLFLFFCIGAGQSATLFGQSAATLSLEQCISKAISVSPLIKQQQINQQLLQLNIKAANNEYLPLVEANIRRSYNWGLFIDPATNILSNFSSQVYSGSLYAEVEVFNGGRIYHTVEQNRQLYEAAGFQKQAIEMQVALEVTKLYYNMYASRQLIQNTNFQLAKSQLLQTKIRKQIAAGILTKKDELNIAIEISVRELSVLKSENAFQAQKKSLMAMLGMNESEVADFNFTDITPIEPEQLQFSKFSKDSLSPMMRSLTYQIQAAKEGVKVAQAAKYPVLSIGGGLTTRSSNLIQTELATQFNNNLSRIAFFNLKIPVFGKGMNNINIERQKLNSKLLESKISNLQFTYANSEVAERAELVNMRNLYLKTKEQSQLYNQQVDLLERYLELGTSTFYEYQIAKNNYIDLQNKLTLLKCELLFKKLLWENYL